MTQISFANRQADEAGISGHICDLIEQIAELQHELDLMERSADRCLADTRRALA